MINQTYLIHTDFQDSQFPALQGRPLVGWIYPLYSDDIPVACDHRMLTCKNTNFHSNIGPGNRFCWSHELFLWRNRSAPCQQHVRMSKTFHSYVLIIKKHWLKTRYNYIMFWVFLFWFTISTKVHIVNNTNL